MIKNILEDKRSQLIARSKSSDKEKIDNKTRFEKRVKSRLANSVRQFNKIDMNQFFKDDLLTVKIEVIGETDTYFVTITFSNVLKNLQRYIIKNGDRLDLRSILRALIDTFNANDIYSRCTCPDFHYRIGYYASRNNTITGPKETIPSRITNPRDTLGPGCKHLMLALSNTSWLVKVASVINNYIKYMQQHREQQFADIIYPALYGKKYNKDVQMNIFDPDSLETDQDTLDTSNKLGAISGRFSSTHQPIRNKKEQEGDSDGWSIKQ